MLFGRFLSPPTDAARSASTSSFVPRSEYYRLLSDWTGEKVNNIAVEENQRPLIWSNHLHTYYTFAVGGGARKKVEKRDLIELMTVILNGQFAVSFLALEAAIYFKCGD